MSSWEIIKQILYDLLTRKLLFVKTEIQFHFHKFVRHKYVALIWINWTSSHHTLWIISLINRRNADRMSNPLFLGTELATGWVALAFWGMKWLTDEQQCPVNWTGGWIGNTVLLGTEQVIGWAALLLGTEFNYRVSSTVLLGTE